MRFPPHPRQRGSIPFFSSVSGQWTYRYSSYADFYFPPFKNRYSPCVRSFISLPLPFCGEAASSGISLPTPSFIYRAASAFSPLFLRLLLLPDQPWGDLASLSKELLSAAAAVAVVVHYLSISPDYLLLLLPFLLTGFPSLFSARKHTQTDIPINSERIIRLLGKTKQI